MNIILIGMPGCGKSTVGVLLAKAMQYSFVDCDLIIQKSCGMSLQEIIDSKGLDTFLAAEEAVLCGMDETDSVIATGGSAVYSDEAMKHLKKDAVTLYISLPCSEIERRLTNIKTRGVAISKGKTISSLYEERCPLYEKYADIILDSDSLDIEDTVERAVALIKDFINSR